MEPRLWIADLNSEKLLASKIEITRKRYVCADNLPKGGKEEELHSIILSPDY